MDDAPLVREGSYELLTCSPVLDTEDARNAFLARIASLITDAGGTVTANRTHARQRLAYPIGQHTAGEYFLTEFRAPSRAPSQVTRELRLMPNILRAHVTVKNAKARTVGANVEAMERDRVARDAAARATTSAKPVSAEQPPEAIENLDEKLEEILGKEMI